MKPKRKSIRDKPKKLVSYEEAVRLTDIYVKVKRKKMFKWIHNVFKYYLQPRNTFNKDKYVMVTLNYKLQPIRENCRSLWTNAILSDVAMAFGPLWPGFTSLPPFRGYGKEYGVRLFGADGSAYILYRLEILKAKAKVK